MPGSGSDQFPLDGDRSRVVAVVKIRFRRHPNAR
jgi:hypothetical protein